MREKQFKTIDEQLELLKERGLIVEDEIQAKDFLLKNNYYRISGYSLSLRSNDKFHPNKRFSDIQDIYYFDSALRHRVLELIAEVEITVKSIYAYRYSEMYNPYSYIDATNFTDSAKHSEIIKKVEGQKDQVKVFELCVKHFLDNNQRFPLWAYIELFTFGNLSQLYSISPKVLRAKVAQDIGFTMNRGWMHLGSSLRVITTLRNMCAHGSRLYNRVFISKPTLSKGDEKYLRKYANGAIDNEHLFSYLLAIKRLVSPNTFQKFFEEFKELVGLYPSVHLSKYGFPEFWESVFTL